MVELWIMEEPTNISIAFSEKCNLHCIMCDELFGISKKKLFLLNLKKSLKINTYREILSYDDRMEILRKLSKWLGPFSITLGGKEPFCNPKIFDLLDYCSQNNIHVFVNTNGTLLSDSRIDRISKYKNISLTFSLDSHNGAIHNRIRRGLHVFEKLNSTIEKLHKRKFFEIYIRTTMMSVNIKDLEKICHFVYKLKIKKIFFQPYMMSKANKNNFVKNPLWPDNKEVSKSINNLIRLKKGEYKNFIATTLSEMNTYIKYFSNPFDEDIKCYAKLTSFRINQFGDVGFCYSDISIYGNLKNTNPEDIFNNRNVKKLEKILSNCKRPCRVANCYNKKNQIKI